MKKPPRSAVCCAFAALSAFAAPVSALAQGGHSAHHGTAVATPAAAELAEGTVRKIDRAAGRITIAHGTIAALEMPPMTMMFRATDPAMLDQVKVGDRIRFAAAEQDGALVVTKLEAAR